MPRTGRCLRPLATVVAVIACSWTTLPYAWSLEPLLAARPATRAQAVAALTGGADLPVPCLSPVVQSLLDDPRGGSPATRRAIGLLQAASHVLGERRFVEQDGTTIRYTLQRASFDRVEAADTDGDGRPDLVDAVLEGLTEARRVLVEQIGLPAPDPVEVVLAKIGGGIEGYTIPSGGSQGRPLLVIDASPDGGAPTAHAAAIHQYAHAVAMGSGSGMPVEWAEALASWAALRVDRGPDARTAQLIANRLGLMSEGLESELLDLAAGNAAWLSFLDENYGSTALRLAVEELSTGLDAPSALDRALRRAGEESLGAALREFQLWSLLVGERSTGRHFSFARRIATPRFASVADGLPALFVQSDPPVGPLGAAAVLLRPAESQGGVTIHFEGETPGRWDADVLLVRPDGSLQRVPFALGPEGRGDLALPLGDVEEAILLVRNLEVEPQAPRRFAWSAHAVKEYPYDLTSVEARSDEKGDTLLTWETASEHGLIGFNVLRSEEGGGAPTRISSVWIPALGDETTPASYQFVDTTAEPDVSYTYQIEGITESGLASISRPLAPACSSLRP